MATNTKTKETWVTTTDNPFDPFKDMDNWKRFDEDNGYHTVSLICRFLKDSDDYDTETYRQCLESAVDAVVEINPTGKYKKVVNPNS